MKKYFSVLTALVLLFAGNACTPEGTNSGSDDNGSSRDNTVRVAGVSLDRTNLTIIEGETVQLVATIKPDNADNNNVSWSSSDTNVASVDNSGKVTALKAGSATITVTTSDGGKTASCVVLVESNTALSVTVGADKISAISAELKGKANLGNTSSSDLIVGFQYSKSAGILPSNSTTVEVKDADANYNYTTAITGLEPETVYYFRSFVRQNGQDTYGDTKEFTTKDVTSLIETLEASSVSEAKGMLNARLDLSDVKYSSLEYGFYWGATQSDLNAKIICTNHSANSYSNLLTGLTRNTQYWYKAYTKVDFQTFYGEVKSFTTEDIVATVVTLAASSVNKTKATLNGKLVVSTTDQFDSSVWFLYSANATTLSDLISSGTMVSSTCDADGTFVCALTDLIYNTPYYFVAVSKVGDKEFYGEVQSFMTLDCDYIAEAVDLGLSVKWSSMNLGADSPEGYGAYFAWGEIEHKSDYTLENYKWYDVSSSSLTKYCLKDYHTDFRHCDLADDAARQKLGGTWRTPTESDWGTLYNYCTWTWTNLNGVNGYKVTSKKTGYKDKWIFLPAAGYWHNNVGLSGVGIAGTYMASSLYHDPANYYRTFDYAKCMSFDLYNIFGTQTFLRFYGFSVRPVCD